MLIVYHREGALVSKMAPGTRTVVGRSAPADAIVEDPTLSRQHACFTADEEGVLVEDMDSKNGTRVNGEPISRARVRPGDQIEMGSVIATLTEVARRGAMTGIEGLDRFLRKMQDEVVRARVFGREYSLLFVRAADRDAHVSGWLPQLRELLRPVDHVTIYAPNTVLVGLPESGESGALDLAERIVGLGAALRLGVASFPKNAASSDELLETARTAEKRASEDDPVAGARAADRAVASTEIVAESEGMRRVFRLVDRVARSAISILLLGETGSGKEVVAAAIHARSPRAGAPLKSINCGAIPATLMESVLFGHEKGAFTGADKMSRGVFEQADGGTVFLDEVGELSPSAQVSLLRVLETKRLTRLAGDREIEVDVRVIAATHRDVDEMVAEGSFRQDLLYRLNTMTIEIPPLRERREDIRPLAGHFLARANAANDTRIDGFTDDAIEALERYGWPGNVRELRNVVERGVVIAEASEIDLRDLPKGVAAGTPSTSTGASPSGAGPFRDRVQQFERELIADALERCDGNQTEAAKLLQMPLRTLVHKIGVYGLRSDGQDR